MIKFNPLNQKELTYAEQCDPAMKATLQEEADQYLHDYTQFIQAAIIHKERLYPQFNSWYKAEALCKSNLAYFAEHISSQVQREFIKKLFRLNHPGI